MFIVGTDASTACKYIVVDTVKGETVLRTNSLREALAYEVESQHSAETLLANSALHYASGLRNPNGDFSQRPMDAVQREFNECAHKLGRDDLAINGTFTVRNVLADKFEEIAASLAYLTRPDNGASTIRNNPCANA